MCAQQHFDIYKEIGVILDNKHRYDRVPKLDETCHEGKVTIIMEPTRLMKRYRKFSMGNGITCNVNCDDMIAATRVSWERGLLQIHNCRYTA